MKDLGYANGWKETPQIVKDCPHKFLAIEHERKGITKYTCEICEYFYRVDSSD